MAAAILAAAMLSHAAWAVPLNAKLVPGSSEVGIRMYALGIFPMDGTFSRFSGSFTFDRAAPASCRVDLSAEVASLHLADPDRQRQALAPDMLDAVAHPTLSFAGRCESADTIAGVLTLHGVSRPLTLSLDHTGDTYTAEGSLRRADWGILGMQATAGSTVRFHVTTVLPQ